MPATEPAWTAARASVDATLRLVLYFDIFRHPLSVEELAALAGGRPALDARCERHGRYVCRAGHVADIAPRIERSRAAETHWPAVLRMGGLLARFPWVRGVLLTGSLSKRSVTPDVDLDFLLLVEHGRVWSAKSFVEAVRRALPAAGRESLCANYIRDERAAELDDHSVFTAIELATAVPLFGDCAPFVAANGWARRWVPGLDFALARAAAAPPLPARRFPEAWLPAGAEALLLRAWDRFWNLKYRALDPATRAQRFKRRPELSTNHFEDFQGKVIAAYEGRCAEAGVAP